MSRSVVNTSITVFEIAKLGKSRKTDGIKYFITKTLYTNKTLHFTTDTKKYKYSVEGE